jgi:hypothetical protein
MFELEKAKPSIYSQVIDLLEKKKNNIRSFNKENFMILLQIFKKYLLFVLYVCNAHNELKKCNALMYSKYMISALKYNVNYYGKQYLTHYYKLNFLLLSLVFNSKVNSSNKDAHPDALQDFAFSFKYFVIFMVWERAKNDHILKAVIGIVTQLAADLKAKGSTDFSSKIEKALKFFDKYSESKERPKQEYLNTSLPEKEARFKYFEEAIESTFSDKNNFLDAEGMQKPLLKE